jgi:hypothetical protein
VGGWSALFCLSLPPKVEVPLQGEPGSVEVPADDCPCRNPSSLGGATHAARRKPPLSVCSTGSEFNDASRHLFPGYDLGRSRPFSQFEASFRLV